MPELPEVETIKRGLEQRIVGKKLQAFREVDSLKSNASAADINTILSGQKVISVNRRGKVLIIDFSGDMSILIHLKMTGQVIVDSLDGSEGVSRFAGGHPTKSMDLVSSLPDSSTRAVFDFEHIKMYFNDQRKFGWIKLLPTDEIYNESLLSKLGPEPHDFDTAKAQSHIKQRLQRTSRPIKAALLDQQVMAGVGNIYADESLHLAKIHPERVSRSLTNDEITTLMQAIETVIQQSIEVGGTSFTNYVNVLGTRGDYLETSRVFKREGQPCRECHNEIIKTRVAGRGTHICLVCQPKPS